MKKILSLMLAGVLCFSMALTLTACDEGSGSDDDGYEANYDDDKDGYKGFVNDVDKAGDGDGKADWDDWNAYAEENGYNKAY